MIRFGGGDIPGFQDRFTKVYKLIAPFIKIIWKKADALVANSSGLKSLAEKFYSKKEILVIPNGANARAFSEDDSVNLKKYDDGKTIRLLFVSRLIERKGLQDFLPQLNSLSKRLGEIGKEVSLDIVGDGPYRVILDKIVNDCNLTNMICFHGQKNKGELPAFYSNADLFVFPSRKEGMPNVVLEAMSYGLPIIMTPCQGSDELIDGNGFAVPVEQFSERIYEIVDTGKLETMGKRSMSLIQNIFT